MTPRLHPVCDFLAVVSASASLTTWQTQIDWTLRVVAALVAIAAGAITIWQRLRKRGHHQSKF